MCGVTGMISFHNSKQVHTDEVVQRMTQLLHHRGPDATRYLSDEHVAYGNTRLAIQDLSENANLPMQSRDEDIWLCYNGEISNFKQLRQKHQLEKDYHFKSNSDSEVIIYLYKKLGISFLNELSGMFAMSIYDRKAKKVYIIRDFYGILPLFYYQTDKEIYFASEIKALLEIPNLQKEINKTAIHHFFSLGYIPSDSTPFKAITELKAGELITIDLEQKSTQKSTYYKFDYKEDFTISEKEAILTTRELLIDSVERNLISDAPLGMTLSGGIDTSAMLGIAKHLGISHKMHTFSLKMGESSFDESPYQRLMAKYANSIHHEILVTPDAVIENMVTQIAHMDEPNGNGANIPSFILAKEASKTVRALLSGEGGDELFNAYPSMAAYQYRKVYRKYLPQPIRWAIRTGVHNLPANYAKLSFDFKAKRFTSGAELSVPEAHLYWRHVFTEIEKQNLLNGDFERPFTTNYYNHIYENSGIDHPINRISLIDMKHFFTDDLMVKNDRTFLANSVEGRFPFMDRILVDYVTKLPVKYRIKGFSKLRWVEKEAMKPFLPNEIYKRDGFGLEMPHAIWFMDKLGKFAEKYLNKKFIDQTELLNWNFIEKIWKIHLSGKQDYGRAIWCVLNYCIWFDLFILSGNYKNYLQKK